MRVIICGGGIGGLTLAHALRSTADVLVIDRDAEAAATGGYRLHLDGVASGILARALPAETWQSIRLLSDSGDSFSRFTIADKRLKPIRSERQDPREDRLLCQRIALRVLLAQGLGETVRFGATVSRVLPTAFGGRVELASGEVLEADLVVGAEGWNSPTVAALAGAPTARPTGLSGLAGTTRLQAQDRLPEFLREGPALALSGDGVGLFLSLVGGSPSDVPPTLRGLQVPPSLVWGVIAAADSEPIRPARGTADQGLDRAVRLLRGWDPTIVGMVSRADPGAVAEYGFRSVPRRASLTPWEPQRVTAIGDAVHCMPPTGGRAAATAIRDAWFLADQLASHAHSPTGVVAAVAAYERAMPAWAVPAVAESRGPVTAIRALRWSLLSVAAGPALGLAADVSSWRSRSLT